VHGLVYANISSLELSETLDGGALALPNQVAGSALLCKLRLANKIEGANLETRRTVHSLKASLGLADARPEKGRCKLQIGGGAPVQDSNVTDWIEYNSTPDQLAEKINALSGIGDLNPVAKVEFGDGAWRIRFGDATVAVTITCVDSELWPVSFVTAEAVEFNGGYTHELRFVQTPVAQSATFGLLVPEAPFITEIQDGGENDGIKWNEVQKLTIPNEYRGAFQLKRGFRRTAPIGLPLDAEELSEAMEVLADDDGSFGFTEEQGGVLIEFQGSMGATDQDPLEVVVFDPPPGDVLVRIDTDTAEMRAMMRKANRDGELALLLEIVMDLEREDADDEYETVIFRTPVVYVAPVSWEAQSVAAGLVWNQPPARRRYIPFSPDQVVIGQRNYFASFGDGVALSFEFNHNLDTSKLHVTVRENASGGDRIPDDEYDVTYDSEDTITLTFASPPASNALMVLITSADFPATFQAHNHDIGEIDGLQEQLTAIGNAIAALQASAGTVGLVVQGNQAGAVVAETMLPTILEIYPTRATLAPAQAGPAIESLAAVTDAMLPRQGGLLPAVHDAVVEDLALPLGTSESLEGKVFKHVGTDPIDLPGSYGVRTVRLKQNQHAAVLVEGDRVSWYRVSTAVDGETSWYPSSFNRELFELAVNDSQLRLKKTLTILCGIELAIFRSNTKASWTFVIEHGTASKVESPEGTGVTFTAATDNTITATGHTYQDGAPVKASTSGTLPTPLVAGTQYYVRDAAANTLKLSLTPGGAVVDITNTGSGTHTLKGQTGQNVAGVTWNPVPLMSQVIHLASTPWAHLLGCRIERKMVNDVDSIVGTQLAYGGETASNSVPASANFYLRGRLIRFDTEDSEPDPRGLVAIMGLARAGVEGDAGESSDIGKAIIK
jgi:hypothetical protein